MSSACLVGYSTRVPCWVPEMLTLTYISVHSLFVLYALKSLVFRRFGILLVGGVPIIVEIQAANHIAAATRVAVLFKQPRQRHGKRQRSRRRKLSRKKMQNRPENQRWRSARSRAGRGQPAAAWAVRSDIGRRRRIFGTQRRAVVPGILCGIHLKLSHVVWVRLFALYERHSKYSSYGYKRKS